MFASLDALWSFGSACIVDLDGDLDLEILVGSRSESVYVFEADGSDMAGWPIWAGGAVTASPCVADLNNDGLLDVVVQANDSHIICFDATGDTLPGWPIMCDVGGDFPPSPTVADLDGDDVLEVIQVDEDGYIYVWTWDGQEFDPIGWPQQIGPARAQPQGSVSVGDVDGDGLPDLVVGDNSKTMHAFHADGEVVAGWPILTDAEIMGSPTLTDLDGDGDVEVIIGGQDKMVYIWDTSGEYLGGDGVQWGTWRSNLTRNGYVGFEFPVGIDDGEFSVARSLVLEQNVPNPFNPVTTIAYTVGSDITEAELGVYNVAGRLVKTLVSGKTDPGRQTVVWDGRDNVNKRVASGIYFVRLSAGERSRTVKMVLLK